MSRPCGPAALTVRLVYHPGDGRKSVWLYPSDATQQGVRFRIGRLENESREISREMDDMLARAACDSKDG